MRRLIITRFQPDFWRKLFETYQYNAATISCVLVSYLGVVIYGEDTYHKKVDFHLSALKPEADMASEASRGRYDLDKPENITGHYRQSNRTSWKNSVIRITRKPLEPDLKLKIQLLAEFCHPSCDMNFADSREKCESLCIIPTTQRNLKHPAPSVRALIISCTSAWFPGDNSSVVMPITGTVNR